MTFINGTERTGVFRCFMSGSSFFFSESTTSNSIHRQPVNNTCRYISTLARPVNCDPELGSI